MVTSDPTPQNMILYYFLIFTSTVGVTNSTCQTRKYQGATILQDITLKYNL